MNFTKKKKLPPKIEDMTKEQLQMFLKKKRDCEANAHTIVLSMLDNEPSENNFIKCLSYISQRHYDDITEERAITKKCGYPLCTKQLSKNIPEQQYKISCKNNKVYDITARKNFCSNECYKASVFIKEQMLTGPLWFREESDIPNFRLLPCDSINIKGVFGEEIDLSIVKKVEIDNKINNGFSSLLDFTEASLEEMSLDPKNKDKELSSVEILKKDNLQHGTETGVKESRIVSNCEEDLNVKIAPKVDSVKSNVEEATNETEKKVTLEVKPNNITSLSADVAKRVIKKNNRTNNIIGDVIERRPENRVDPIISAGQDLQQAREHKSRENKPQNNKLKKQPKSLATFIIHIEKCLSEWFSLETMLFLFGEARVKQMVADKGECIKEYLNNMACGLLYKSTSYDQYQQLCRKLNLLELEDRRYDNKVVQTQEMKPLPHYSILKEENQLLDIKVRAFFKGDTLIPTADMSATTIEAANKANEDDEEEGKLTNLPLVDKRAQNALRRKIVLTSLNKILPDLLQTLGISSREVSNDVRLLVATLNLQAHNIFFKPLQWNMIAIICIKLVSIRNTGLAKLLEKEMAHKHLQLLLMSYEQDGGYLDRLILWLTDIDRLLDSTDTQLTDSEIIES